MIKLEKGNHEDGEKETSRLRSLVLEMERVNNPEEIHRLIGEFLDLLSIDLGLKLESDVTKFYREMQNKKFLARLENLKRVIDSLIENLPLKIGDENDHYANAVLPENEGLRIAFAEGDPVGPVRLLIGFEVKSLIGFDPKGLGIYEIDVDEFDVFRNQRERARFCRHVVGELKPEQIHYLIMRVPRSYFPENLLSEEEIKSNRPFIFRGARIESRNLVR